MMPRSSACSFAAILFVASLQAAGTSFRLTDHWLQLPQGMQWGDVSAVAVDSHGAIYAFQRAEPPIVVFDARGKFLRSFGNGMFVSPHGLRIDREGFLWAT